MDFRLPKCTLAVCTLPSCTIKDEASDKPGECHHRANLIKWPSFKGASDKGVSWLNHHSSDWSWYRASAILDKEGWTYPTPRHFVLTLDDLAYGEKHEVVFFSHQAFERAFVRPPDWKPPHWARRLINEMRRLIWHYEEWGIPELETEEDVLLERELLWREQPLTYTGENFFFLAPLLIGGFMSPHENLPHEKEWEFYWRVLAARQRKGA